MIILASKSVSRPIVAPESLVKIAMPINMPSRPMIVSVNTSDPRGSPRTSASLSATLIAPNADHTIVAKSQRKSRAATGFEIGS